MSISMSTYLPIEDDVWLQHRGVIKTLYQDNGKTLAQVKQAMETSHGFPKMPMSSWEIKLRDLLGLRKKLKKGDWAIIYSHVQYRRQQGEKTDIYLNDTPVQWAKAWKEMRRCGVTKSQLARPAHLPLDPLPRGIVLRTPTTTEYVPLSNALSLLASHTVADVAAVPSARSIVEPQYIPVPTQPMPLQRFEPSFEPLIQSGTTANSVLKLCLESTPFNISMWKLTRTSTNTNSAPGWQWSVMAQHHNLLLNLGLNSRDVDSSGCLDLAVAMSQLSLGLHLAIRRAASMKLSTNLDIHYYIAMAVYIFSNRLYATQSLSDWSLCWDVLVRRTPRTTLISVLRSNTPSMKAAWETLLMEIYVETFRCDCNQISSHPLRDLYSDLMHLGFHNGWIDRHIRPHSLLSRAAYMDCVDVVRTLMNMGYRQDTHFRTPFDRPGIVGALYNNNLECAKLLIEHCDVNRPLIHHQYGDSQPYDDPYPETLFSMFIAQFRNDRIHTQVLELFLEQGADVDTQFGGLMYHAVWDKTLAMTQFYERNDISKEWDLTVLDYCYYCNRPLYKRLMPHSRASSSQITRTRILDALELGSTSLREYLEVAHPADPGAKEWFLQMILVEQCMLEGLEGPQVPPLALLEFGVDPTLPSLEDAPDLGCAVIRQIHRTDDHSKRQLWMRVLQLLSEKGAFSGSGALKTAVDTGDISILQYLISCTADVASEGREALAEAGAMNNFKAVDVLLKAGVDINSYIERSHERMPLLALALDNGKREFASCGMMKYLVEKGAKLLASPDGWHPCHFLLHVLRNTPLKLDLVQKVQYIVENHADLQDPSTPCNDLLEACLSGGDFFFTEESRRRLDMLEYLLQKGVRPCPSALLPPLILLVGYAGERQHLIQDLIDADANINTYALAKGSHGDFISAPIAPLQAAARSGNEHLVKQLLAKGVEVDPIPMPDGAETAIQCICHWNPVTPEESLRRLKIIQSLLDHGAEVNGSCVGINRKTALQTAAEEGALDVATLLLRHGANINAAAGNGYYALDIATELCHVDMVQLLLNANAISSRPGHTGYDGAIKLARQHEFLALADLIEKHAENNSKDGIRFHPIMPIEGQTGRLGN